MLFIKITSRYHSVHPCSDICILRNAIVSTFRHRGRMDTIIELFLLHTFIQLNSIFRAILTDPIAFQNIPEYRVFFS